MHKNNKLSEDLLSQINARYEPKFLVPQVNASLRNNMDPVVAQTQQCRHAFGTNTLVQQHPLSMSALFGSSHLVNLSFPNIKTQHIITKLWDSWLLLRMNKPECKAWNISILKSFFKIPENGQKLHKLWLLEDPEALSTAAFASGTQQLLNSDMTLASHMMP